MKKPITIGVISVIIGVVVFSGALPVFAEEYYGILENKFYNQPIVCIYEPDVPEARQVIKDRWVKETELGVKFWQYELQAQAVYYKDKWNIETIKIPLEDQIFFDNKDCDVEIRFTNQQIDYEAIAAGWHWFDGTRSQIEIMYVDLEICNVRHEGNYRITEWCYKEDFVRSKALGNIATHEFGHAMGLNHYVSDDPQENYDWSVDPYASPSVMTLAVHYDEDKNKIRTIDIDKVNEIYTLNGFGEPKQTTPQNIPIFEEKNLGGFESFFTSQTEYVKERGNVKYVTISGKVSEESYSRGQNVLINIVFPDGDDKELKALTVSNREFSIQVRVDETIQTGVYTLEAKYMGYDSEKISFTVLDGISYKVQPKEETLIPNWIRNNAKWWADGTIKDRDFLMGIQYLTQQKIIIVESTTQSTQNTTDQIPEWIRNNAKWWADGLITDSDFVKGIQFLAQQGIIQVN